MKLISLSFKNFLAFLQVLHLLYSKNNSSYCNFSMEMMNRTRYSSKDFKTEEEKEQEKIRKQIQELSNRKEVIQVLTFV